MLSTAGDPEPSGGSQAPNTVPDFIISSDVISPSGAVEPLAPAVLNQIEAINMDQDSANTGFLHIPPDTHGAVGPLHFVAVVNSSIEWRTKAGVLQQSKALGSNSSGSIIGSFFESLAPVNGLFDPKVVYDQHAGRFVVVALEREDTATVTTSRVLVAVSATSDPNGGWHFLAINSLTAFSTTNAWADYPGLAVDEEAVYFTANFFGFSGGAFQGNRIWIIGKGVGTGGFYDGGTASFSVNNPVPGGLFEGTQ